MDVGERIELLRNHFNLSNSEFAGKINVQPSTLSHIFSGRNRPSIDLILKIKNVFPQISLDWLLLEEGNMEKNKQDDTMVSPGLILNEKTEKSTVSVERIVLFFDDGSFKIYKN